MTSQQSLALNPEQAARVVARALHKRKPILLVGAPGVGKTELLMQAAEVAEHDILLSYPAIEDPTDPKGLPWFDPKSGKGDFVPLGVLKRALESKRPTLWVLEDLGQAADAVQAAYMSVLSTRTIGSHKLPDHVTIVATTNRREHRAGVRGILEPVKSRFKTIIEVVPEIESWVDWAMANGKNAKVIAYLRCNPDDLLVLEPTLEITNSRNPRTWSALCDWVSDDDLDEDLRPAVYAGTIGVTGATKLIAFLATINDMPSPEAVLLAPDTVEIPDNSSTLYALVKAVAYYVDDSSFPNVIRFAERLHTEGRGELAGMLVKDCVLRKAELLSTSAFADVATGPLADLIQ